MLSNTKHITQEQRLAIDMCCDRGLTIVGITGGAGTGKTFVLGEAYKELREKFPASQVVLCAPTGRAAKRIQELTKIPAKTVHRLLEFPMPDDKPIRIKGVTPDEAIDGTKDIDDSQRSTVDDTPPNMPRRNRGNRLDQKVVFVDESSMVSPSLYRHLLDALPNDGVIRFFGDNNQLPPVEQGIPPFIDVLERQPHVELTLNFRSDDEIVANALRILQGRIPVRNGRFEIIYTEAPIGALLKFATKEFMQEDHQIIMPTRRGKVGTNRVNPSLQVKFNGRGPSLKLARYDEKEAPLVVRAGDKAIWVKNDYNLKLFNGDIGQIDWLNTEDGALGWANTEGVKVIPPTMKTFSLYHGSMIQYDPRKQIELGYAVTTHKAQGSEFDTVVYCMCGAQAFLLDRGNFYTAVTRAKKRVVLITDRRAMGLSLRRRRENR